MHASASRAIRAKLIAAMEQRAASVNGGARRELDARLTDLREKQTEAQGSAESGDVAPSDAVTSRAASGRATHLGELVKNAAGNQVIDRAAYPELPALKTFRSVWSTIRSDSHLQQAAAQTSTDAGPLNSAALVSRSMALMRELSPGYLRQFLAYVDDLAWLEQLDTASGAAPTKKRSRRKQR